MVTSDPERAAIDLVEQRLSRQFTNIQGEVGMLAGGAADVLGVLPSPSTADPSVTTATVFRLMVNRRALAGTRR